MDTLRRVLLIPVTVLVLWLWLLFNDPGAFLVVTLPPLALIVTGAVLGHFLI